MSGCHPTEVKKCECLYHINSDVDFNGLVCCECSNKIYHDDMDLILFKTFVKEITDKLESRIKRIEDFHIRNFNERIESLESQLKALTEMYKHLSMLVVECQDYKIQQIDENRKLYDRIDGVINEIVRSDLQEEKYSIDHEQRIEKLEKDLTHERIMRKDLRDYCMDRLGSALHPDETLNVFDRIVKLEEKIAVKAIDYETHIGNHIRQIRELDQDLGMSIDRIEKLEANLKVEDRISASDVLCRLTKLESEQLGQQLDPKVWVFVNDRLDKLETEINIVRALGSRDYNSKKPHKCPICDGKGYWHDVENNIATGGRCSSCEGKGVLWG